MLIHQARDHWVFLLQDHPDRVLVNWFLHGLQFGFLVGSSLPTPPDAIRLDVPDSLRNNKSAIDNASTPLSVPMHCLT